MSELFLELVNRSVSVTWLLLAIFMLRLLLKKAPKWVNVLLWGLVAVRLLCPFSVESVLSLIPSAETISPGIMTDPTPAIHSGVSFVNDAVNPMISESLTPSSVETVTPLQVWISFFTLLWGIGVLILLLYSGISYFRLKSRVRTAVRLCDNMYQCETVTSPFVMGFIRPRIYLSFAMPMQDMEYFIAHEQMHIRRKDHWWKPLGFIVLVLYWFHPMLWVAYVLLCRDIELACDEKVIKELGTEQRADYSQTLLSCSVNRKLLTACPLAFGEVGVKERVKHVLSYKKPAFWIILVAMVACIVVAVCFLTNPKENKQESINYIALEELPADYSLEQAKEDGCVVMEDGDVTYGQEIWESFYKTAKEGKAASVRVIHYYTLGDPEQYAPELYEEMKAEYPMMFILDLNYDGVRYRVRHFEEGKELVREYPYLVRYEWEPDSPDATFDYEILYVVTDDNTVTWEEIWRGMLSSSSHTYVPRHKTIYSDYIYTN